MKPEAKPPLRRLVVVQDEAGLYLLGRPPDGYELEIREWDRERGSYTRVYQSDGESRLENRCKKCGNPWTLKDRKCAHCLNGKTARIAP